MYVNRYSIGPLDFRNPSSPHDGKPFISMTEEKSEANEIC